MRPCPFQAPASVHPGPWLLLFLLILATPLTAAEKGGFGFRLNVKLGGAKSSSIFSFRISSAVVQAVTPDSPAAMANVSAGDQLVEVGNMVVSGGKGLQLKARLTPPPGTAVSMKFKRPDGEIYAVVLTAAPPNSTRRP